MPGIAAHGPVQLELNQCVDVASIEGPLGCGSAVEPSGEVVVSARHVVDRFSHRPEPAEALRTGSTAAPPAIIGACCHLGGLDSSLMRNAEEFGDMVDCVGGFIRHG